MRAVGEFLQVGDAVQIRITGRAILAGGAVRVQAVLQLPVGGQPIVIGIVDHQLRNLVPLNQVEIAVPVHIDRDRTSHLAGAADLGGAICDFCQIDTGKPAELDRDEPRRVAESVRTMGLRYSTVTGVARDDLPDGGAWLYAETVRQIHELNPGTGVELLIPDFNALDDQLGEVFATRPEVLAHNLETVPRIFKRIRPAFRYDRSLLVLTKARAAGLVTKSNLILGMGETPDEVTAALADLHEAGCEIITITQYLRPTPRHHPVERWVKPEEFVAHATAAEEMGFAGVMAGPLVRSSYRAGRLYAQTKQRRGEPLPEALEHLAEGGAAAQEAASLLAR